MRAGRGRPGLAVAARVARWIGGWPARRVGLAAVAGGLLVLAAVIGYAGPLLAQDGEAPEATGASGVSIRMDDLVGRITYTIVDRFEVQLAGLDASATYEVRVSSDSASLGIGGCGTAAQTETVTGATAQNLYFIVYACGVGAGTVTAEVRRAGAATAEVAVRQRMTVQPIPDYVPADERLVKGAAVAQVGTPGIVPNLQHERWATSFKMTWGKPADGGVTLSGYGLLMWKGSQPQPGWGTAESIPPTPQSKEYTGLELDTLYKFRIHACSEDENNPARCGWWTDVHEVRTGKRPDPPHTISFDQKKTTSARATWSAAADTGGVPLTGFQIRYWRPSDPSNSTTVMVDSASARSTTLTGLTAGTAYEAKLRSCNDESNCTVGAWSADHSFETPRDARTPPGPVRELKFTSRGDHTVALGWAAPSSSGSAALASYHVQHRVYEGPNREPWAQVGHDDVLSGTSHTIGGLTNGTWYDVQVRACNRDNLCGAWTVVDAPVYPGQVVGSAHLSPASAAIERGQRQKFEIHNIPVGKTAYAHLTGPIQPERRCDTSTEGAVGPRAPTPSTGPGYYDSLWIEGCADGYGWLRVVDANDDELYARATILVGPMAPGQVARPVVRARDGALHVDWEAPSSGGTPTHYVVGYRAGASGDWTETEVSSGTSTTITELTNGTSYQVRVRAVNAKGDGDWSETVTGTPQVDAGAPGGPGIPGSLPVPTISCEQIPSPDPSSPPAPTDHPNLDFTPQLYHFGLLTWSHVPNAMKYQVEVRRLEADGWGDWGPPDRRIGKKSSGLVSQTCLFFNIGEIIRMSEEETQGLADSKAWGFQVRALNYDPENNERQGPYSHELIIIDTPITSPNGHSPTGSGQISLSWSSVSEAMKPRSSDYDSGDVHFRYRQAVHSTVADDDIPHSKIGWEPKQFKTAQNGRDEFSGVVSENPITDLSLDVIYAIQFRLENTGPADTSKVYAARDSFAWTSGSRPANGSRIATFPMGGPIINTDQAYSDNRYTYEYQICRDGFGDDIEEWQIGIQHAFGRWAVATGGLVRAAESHKGCADIDTLAGHALGVINRLGGIHPGNKDLITNLIISFNRLASILESDINANEVIMINDEEGVYHDLYEHGAFTELSINLGIAQCVFIFDACAATDRDGGAGGRIADIMIRKSSFGDGVLNIDLTDPQYEQYSISDSAIQFNECVSADIVHDAYGMLVHEVGHAFGIIGGVLDEEERAKWRSELAGHSAVFGSVMNYDEFEWALPGSSSFVIPADNDCSPHPLDIMAVYALYIGL